MFLVKIILLLVVIVPLALGQRTFTFDGVSEKYTARLKVDKFESGIWRGKTTVAIFRKGSARPFQVLYLNNTHVSLDDSGQPEEAEIRDQQNGKWSTVYLDDLNFDGLEDLAVADGTNGGYASVSYRVYLFDRSRKKFIYSKEFTRLSQGPYFGIPLVNARTKTLEVFWKSGAGFHEVQRYKVIKKKPVKVYERSDSTASGDGKRYLTIRKLINGRWRTWTKTTKENRPYRNRK